MVDPSSYNSRENEIMMCSVVLVIMNSKEIHMFFFVVSTLVYYIYLLWYTVSKYIDLKNKSSSEGVARAPPLLAGPLKIHNIYL